MKIGDINKGDVLVRVDKDGSGYYRVLKINRVTVTVKTEQGETIKAYPHFFDGKTTARESQI